MRTGKRVHRPKMDTRPSSGLGGLWNTIKMAAGSSGDRPERMVTNPLKPPADAATTMTQELADVLGRSFVATFSVIQPFLTIASVAWLGPACLVRATRAPLGRHIRSDVRTPACAAHTAPILTGDL